jgi:hypothetical protein
MLATALAALTFAAPLKYRWFYLATNFFVPEQVDKSIALLHRAARAGYNGVLFTDSKLESQDPFPDFYVKRVERFLAAAKADHVEVIPAVLPVGYADGMLARDPTLVESMPYRKVALRAFQSRLETIPQELYQNGGFESANGDKPSGTLWQDGPGKVTFIDHTQSHSGSASFLIVDPGINSESNGNARIVQRIRVEPWHQYRLSLWIKTQDFDRAGSVNATILDAAGQKSLNFQALQVASSQPWQQSDVVFDSQGQNEILVYLGVWDGHTGKMWFDDVSLQDVGLLNVTRRENCPLVITDAVGRVLKEGTDFANASDPMFGNVPWPGEFEFTHAPPSVPIPAGSSIHNGDTVFADYYAATLTDSGKSAICLADPATAALEAREVERVIQLFRPSGVLLSQDELRVAGWCGACQKSGLSPGQLVENDIHRSIGYLKGRTPFVWSDMFDPRHNAVSNYYLVNGSLTGSWKGLSPDTVIMNWNSGKPNESLKFFADKGFHQMLAGYYDGSPESIGPWMDIARKFPGFDGVMYTTWQGKYTDLEAFAKAAWGG